MPTSSSGRVLPILAVSCALLALLAGFAVSRYLFNAEPVPQSVASSMTTDDELVAATSLIGQRRPDFRHARSDGAIVSMSDFDQRVVLVNFWATWCGPCREEMPLLEEWAERYAAAGLDVVGIALDDVERVRRFAQDLHIQYPLLVGGPDVEQSSRNWGNQRGVLPYSVVVDRHGIVRWTHFGPLDSDLLQHHLLPLLEQEAGEPAG